MPRRARVLIDDGTYHILTRGNNGQAIFHEEADYQRYLQLLATYTVVHRLSLHHFILMPNHVHLVLSVAVAVMLSKAMLGLNLAYALFYRKRYRYRGHLWQGRFQSALLDRNGSPLECGRHVELHPVRRGLVQDPTAYEWSSYRVYAHGVHNPLITPNPLYELLGVAPPERQERYRQFVRDGLQPRHPHLPLDQNQFGFLAAKGNRGRPKKALVYPPR